MVSSCVYSSYADRCVSMVTNYKLGSNLTPQSPNSHEYTFGREGMMTL